MVSANKIEKFFSNSGTRNEVRERVITEFLKELQELVMAKINQNIFTMLKL